MTTTNISAVPEQRIIIQFTHALSAEEEKVLSVDLRLLIQQEVVRAGHSTNERWIIVLSAAVSEQVLSKFVDRIQQHDLVDYAETDVVLQHFQSSAPQ